MPGKDTTLAFSKTMNPGKKRTRVSQQASSGAPEPAPERAPDLGADVQKEMSSSSSAKQGGQRIQVGQPSRSGAPEPAAIDGAVQFDNDDDNEPRGLGGAPEPAALVAAPAPAATGAAAPAAAPATAPASCGQTWLGVQVTPFLQRIFEEQAARNAQSRRKAIEDFHRFSGCHNDFQRIEACHLEDLEPHPGGESLWPGAESL